jgi:hypothetical protein
MKTPQQVELFLASHWFINIKEAHLTRNYLMGIFTSKKFVFKYPISSMAERIATLITAEEAINYINEEI